jgi:nitrate reductase beta subunit
MVMNLDKCIGCHTCSVTCKQAWTNRTGMSTSGSTTSRPGPAWAIPALEDQEKWKGG